MNNIDYSRFQSYLKVNKDASRQWKSFDFSQWKSICDDKIHNELIPFYGTPYFSKLTEEEKKELYFAFIGQNAEATILFEKLLLFSFRSFEKRTPLNSEAVTALKKLLFEEYLHSRAFKKYLTNEPRFGWPKKTLLLDKNWARWLILRAGRLSPISLCLCGVKIEYYTLAYAQLLKEVFGSWESNNWIKLNQLHQIDEAHHVPLQLELFKSGYLIISQLKRVYTLFMLYWIIFLIQCVLFRGSLRMTAQAFPRASKIKKIYLSFKIAKWIVREFPPYKKARERTKTLILKRNPPMKEYYSIIYW